MDIFDSINNRLAQINLCLEEIEKTNEDPEHYKKLVYRHTNEPVYESNEEYTKSLLMTMANNGQVIKELSEELLKGVKNG